MEKVPDGKRVFELWLEKASTESRDPLKVESAAPYRDIWNAWLDKVQPHGIGALGMAPACGAPAWSTATAVQLASFLAPRDVEKSGHNKHQLSMVTRRRYYQVLVRIYDFAMTQGWVQIHPAQGMEDSAKPKAGDQRGQILPPGVWEQLPECFPDGDSDYDARDRAVLTLLYELALAPEEIRLMRPSDLSLEDRPYSLKINGTRPRQARKFPLSEGTRSTLQEWLARRAAHGRLKDSEWLFPSRRGHQMPISTLFTLVSDAVKAAALQLGIQDRNDGLMRVGPQVLRNTAIVRMFASGEHTAEFIVGYLGLKNEKGLDRLRHRISPKPL